MKERIWVTDPDPERVNARHRGTLADMLGIRFVEFGDDFLVATMPVDDHTRQPYGLLHGGATAALAETLGSVGGVFSVDPESKYVVGLSIDSNHLRPVREGMVKGTARAVHLGRTTQVWQIEVENERGKLVNISRLTLAVREIEQDLPAV